jgi:hypothetical protein
MRSCNALTPNSQFSISPLDRSDGGSRTRASQLTTHVHRCIVQFCLAAKAPRPYSSLSSLSSTNSRYAWPRKIKFHWRPSLTQHMIVLSTEAHPVPTRHSTSTPPSSKCQSSITSNGAPNARRKMTSTSLPRKDGRSLILGQWSWITGANLSGPTISIMNSVARLTI